MGKNNLTTENTWSLPDSEICTDAIRLAFDVSPVLIANHCVRSFVFAREIAAGQGQRGGVDYDEELVFLACILHDLGVTDYGDGDQRFEVDGADAAARFLREQQLPEERITTIWQSIALHTSVGLGHRFGPEQSVSFHGIAFDINGFDQHLVPPGFADRVHTEWPRHDLGFGIASLIARGTKGNPLKAPPLSFPAHVHSLVHGNEMSFFDMLKTSPWGDQPISGGTDGDAEQSNS